MCQRSSAGCTVPPSRLSGGRVPGARAPLAEAPLLSRAVVHHIVSENRVVSLPLRLSQTSGPATAPRPTFASPRHRSGSRHGVRPTRGTGSGSCRRVQCSSFRCLWSSYILLDNCSTHIGLMILVGIFHRMYRFQLPFRFQAAPAQPRVRPKSLTGRGRREQPLGQGRRWSPASRCCRRGFRGLSCGSPGAGRQTLNGETALPSRSVVRVT